jgi:hypothetical protein
MCGSRVRGIDVLTIASLFSMFFLSSMHWLNNPTHEALHKYQTRA